MGAWLLFRQTFGSFYAGNRAPTYFTDRLHVVIRDSTSKETDAQRYEDLKRFSRDKFKRDAVNESAVKFVPSLSYYLTEYRRKSSECHEVGEHVFDNVRATNSISGLERGSGCIVVNFNQTATATGSSRASRG